MQQQSRRFAIVDGLMALVCLFYTGTIVVMSWQFWPFMVFALVPLLAGVSLLFRARRIAFGMQVCLGLIGVLIGFWWCGMAGMVTNGAQGSEAQKIVREIQMSGLIVILPITALHFIFARHLHFREEE
ncbi:hypothetical protein [Armatimonas sp.]|uniref:hypothetical protein n=1 Tax=Armatimonas sp. TaxID=1872638 RepID=UPI0037537DA5